MGERPMLEEKHDLGGRERAMPRYWLYFKSSGGDIVRALPLECADDREAIAWVESRRETADRELWLRRRRIRFWPSSANEP